MTAPAELSGPSVVTYSYEGLAFAVESPLYLLEPANAPGEPETLRRLWREITLPLQFDGDWNRAVAKRFLELANRLTGRLGASRRVITLLREWSVQHAAYRETGDRAIAFELPLTDAPATLATLTADLLGLSDPAVLHGAFSDGLLLCEGVPPFDQPLLNERCAVRNTENLYAIPPIGPLLARWLTDRAAEAESDLYRPQIPPESFAFEAFEDEAGRKVRARMSILRRRRVQGATYVNRIDLTRVYTLGAELAHGAAVPLPTRELPGVRLWPAARLSPGLWTAYYVLTQRPEAVDVLIPTDGGFAPGEPRRAVDEPEGSPRAERHWQISRVSRWPLYVALGRGKLSLGALPNDEPLLQLKRESAAAIAIDFGSNATTVMLRQGEHIRPAALSPRLLKTLLHSRATDDLTLPDEFLPPRTFWDELRPSTFVSAMDMFGDDDEHWRQPLMDGHIYYAPDMRRARSEPLAPAWQQAVAAGR